MFELIQYRPATAAVRQIPLLIVPPTINKFYVLDLAPGRSMAEYLIGAGQQVFMISWRNPDARHAAWDFSTYGQAILDAMDAAARITGSSQTALMGTCSGGVLTAMVAGHLAHIGEQDRIAALTLMVTVLRPGPGGGWRCHQRAHRTSGGRHVPSPRLPGRPVTGRGLRVAAARSVPDLELLGQQRPARTQAAAVRHPVLERGHHSHDRRPAPGLPAPGCGERAGAGRRRDHARLTGGPGGQSTERLTWSPGSPITSAPGRAATSPPRCCPAAGGSCCPPADTSRRW